MNQFLTLRVTLFFSFFFCVVQKKKEKDEIDYHFNGQRNPFPFLLLKDVIPFKIKSMMRKEDM